MNWKVISRNIGYALLVSALFMFLSVLVSMAEGNDSALAALAISFTITFIVGIFPFIFVRKSDVISLKEGYVIITLSWLMSFVFGMLPYALYGGPFTLINAWFESVSGFTTCGSTILDNVEALPKSLLFWRTSTHFIGGLGVVVFLLLIIPESSPMRLRLTNMELTSLSRSGYSSRPNKVVYIFAYVYLGLALAALVAYLCAGMSVFDAVCHAMSVVSTGGFSTRNLSIASFDSRWVEGITMIFMYLASLHFGVLYMAVVTRSLRPVRNPIFKFYTAAILVITLLVSIGLKANGFCDSWGESVWNGLFSTLSISSTTGFAIMDNAVWPVWMSMLLVCIGIVCGCSGSTASGLKVDRLLIISKAIGRYVNNILNPHSVNEVRLGKRILRDEEVAPHLLYAALYGLLLVIAVIFAMFTGLGLEDSVSGTIVTLGDIGFATGAMGSMGSFNHIPVMSKLLFTLNMFLGRIEIYPVLAVAGMVLRTKGK